MKIGIDFGTTHTVVAAAVDGNHPLCTFNWKGEIKAFIPSIAVVHEGDLFFGWEAAERLDFPEAVLIRSIKRLMGVGQANHILEPAPGFSLSVQDLVIGFLGHVGRMIVEQGNLEISTDDPLEVLAATPANADSNQRYMTLEAFRRAGFKVIGAMNEPSAAAVEYAHRYLKKLGPKSPKEYIIVYDLGGGTFDTSVVGLAGRHFEVLAHEGIARLGGDDFDRIILDLALEKSGISLQDLTESQIGRLLEECRERKEGIKPNTRRIMVDLSPALGRNEEQEVVLATADIFERCTPLVDQTLDSIRSVMGGLSGHGIEVEDIRTLAAVYLVGGSAAFPPVARNLREVYASKIKVSPYPFAATAIGLAICVDPDMSIKVRESISRHFGVWREHEHGREKVFDPIISKNDRIDQDSGSFQITRLYHPAHNIGHLRYLECTALGPHNEPAGDITLWPEILFPYDPNLNGENDLSGLAVQSRPDLAGQEVLETYTYDRSGMVRVQIHNRTSEYGQDYTLNRPGVLG